MWQCDGCGAQFDNDESPEAQAHFAAQLDLPAALVTCWGLMEVGGPAWQAFQDGVHPMTAFTADLESHLLSTGAIVEVLRERHC